GAVAQIEILGERIVLPAARVVNRRAPPDAGRAVEIEEQAAAVASAVLEDEMTVQENGLNLRQQRVVFVDMAPARLHHADLRLREVRHEPDQKIGGRDEVRVEDGD